MPDIVQILVQHPNIDVNLADNYGVFCFLFVMNLTVFKMPQYTPLHRACIRAPTIDMFEILCAHPNIDVNAVVSLFPFTELT